MLSLPQVQRYSAQSGLRDIMIAEKEIILTFLLQLLAERGMLNRFAFKGGTCLRKMIIGSQGRFSTDLDFTALEEHDHETIILDMMDAFAHPFHGIQFHIPDDSYYNTQDGLSWGVNPTYIHSWNNSGESEVKIQVSRRETPTLAIERRPQCEQTYFKLWDDLSQLVRRTAAVNREKITTDCVGGYRFLVDLTEEERQLANDPYQRERILWQKLRTKGL